VASKSDPPFSAPGTLPGPNPSIYNHGILQGGSQALDLETLWALTVRPLNQPAPSSVAAGRSIFGERCASCHGGAKWTKSQSIYLSNPSFVLDGSPRSPRDPRVTNDQDQIISYAGGGNTLRFLEDVGTFDANDKIEIRSNGTASLGSIGFNVPSLLDVAYHHPYLHSGKAQTLAAVFSAHTLGGGTIESVLNSTQRADLTKFLNSIDGRTPIFPSATDEFRNGF
jgi:hypothetical protein